MKKQSSFNKVLAYAKPYKGKLFLVGFWAFFLAIVAALRPLLLNLTVDNYLIAAKKESNIIQDSFAHFMNYFFADNDKTTNLQILVIIMFVVLLLEVIAQFYFVYLASWLGQDIVKDIREKLFHHLSNFKMKYFDNEPVGKLITRCVS